MVELEHVGIAVDDLQQTLAVLEDVLQISPYKSEAIEKDRIRTHFLRAGGAKLELLESLDPESPVARFIEKRGPGLHHLAFEVDDVEAAHRRVSEAGYRPLDDEPRTGADGKRIFFLHPKETAGILVEFCQSVASTLEEAGSVGALRIRRSAGRSGPAVVYLHATDVDPAPPDLACRLEQRFAFRAVESPGEADDAAVRDGLADPSAVVAAGPLVPSAVRYAADVGVKALVLIDPPARLWPVELACPVLVVGRDRGDGLETALEARSSLAGSKLAVVPDGDPMLVAQFVERHLARALLLDS